MAVGAKLRYEVLKRDSYTCRFCGSRAPDVFLEIDHVIPRACGGQDVASNLQVLCEECNRGKSMTMPERWLVKEVRKAAERGWEPAAEVPDDCSEMYAYQDAYAFLESLPAADVLRAVMRIHANVFPYRPCGSEVIIAAAKFIADELAATGEASR